MWNIAKSAEAMFSRWAVKRVCKFLLKKKLGQFILGDIDLDQLDVQLTEGTIQLTDLALNADFLNAKLSEAASLYIKEGSIGSLLVRMPWKGKGCEVELDEFEVVLAPCVDTCSSNRDETHNSSETANQNVRHGQGNHEREMFDNGAASPGDLHEGVKIIAKMVKWLLTSFNVKIKKLIIAFSPDSQTKTDEYLNHKTLVLRVAEIECGTCVSEDGSVDVTEGIDSFLGMNRLTNYVTFQGAVLELIQIDDVFRQKSTNTIRSDSFEVAPDLFPASAGSPIMTGKTGGVSGNIKLSIPWKNGSLDIRKVDAEVSVDPTELRFQPSTIKWLLLSWETLKNLGKDAKTHVQIKPREDVDVNSIACSSSLASVFPKDSGNAAPVSDVLPPIMGRGSVYDVKLPCLISDWVPSSVSIGEPDFGASVDQFFECFDGMRNSQSALGGSGMWNWTCSVFSAITAASSLASGSLHISSEQQHVETNLTAAVAGLSLIFSFHDEDGPQTSNLDSHPGEISSYLHYLVLGCSNIYLRSQVCPRDLKFEGTLTCIELDHCISHREIDRVFVDQSWNQELLGKTATIKELQDEVQRALPQHASVVGMPEHRPTAALAQKCPSRKDDIIKIALLRTSGVLHCQLTVKSGLQNDKSNGAMSFSVNLPPFVFWVNFGLMVKLFTFMEEVQRFVESSDPGMRSSCKVKQSSQTNARTCPARPRIRGSETRFTTLSSEERLRGIISVPHARVILCFPFHAKDDLFSYSSCNEFIALDVCSPLTSAKGKSMSQFPEANLEKRFSVTMTRSLYLNIGNLNIYLVSLGSEDCVVGKSSSGELGKKFVSKNIISSENHSMIHMIWQEGPVTGPWIAERAKSIAMSQESSNRNRFMGKGHDFASVKTVKGLDDSSSVIREEIVLSSSFFLHAHLAPVVVNLGKSHYKGIHSLLNQIIEGFSHGCDGASIAKEESSGHQTSVLVECDSLEIVIMPEKLADVKSSLLSELPGSWCQLKLKIKNFELLNVSNIGGLDGANFFWLSHAEGELRGTLSTLTDQDFLLILCADGTMKRGDGEGSNALSSGRAGSDIIYLWEPTISHGYTSIILRCATIVANGGRLDWFDSLASIFSLPSDETENNPPAESDGQTTSGSSFALTLVDIGVSYEPYLKSLMVDGENARDHVACLLAASSFYLSNTTEVGTVVNDYNIRVQDLGLLLCSISGLEHPGGIYDVQHLRKFGYVKIAHEALIEATLRINSQSEILWQLECSNSQIDVETCGDTTVGLIKLATQLQQLLAPNVEESLMHLQTRWNNLQKAEDIDSSYDEMRQSMDCESELSTPQIRSLNGSSVNQPVRVGLMDEISEVAFLLSGNQIQQDYSESQLSAMLEESLLVDTCHDYIESPEIVSPGISFGGAIPFVGSEGYQASELQKDYFPEFIEGYCISDLRSLSELTRSSGETIKCNDLESIGMGGEKSGWYRETSLNIMEDHISETSDLSSSRQSIPGDFSNPSLTNLDNSSPKGRVLVENINIRWRMYAGSDWENTRKKNGRDTNICLELVLSGLDFHYDMFPVGGFSLSKLSLAFKDIYLYDNSADAPLKLVLGYYNSKHYPRESSSKAFKLELDAIRPDPSIPLEEYQLCISLLPLRLNLHQRQLDFFINFFGGEEVSHGHPREKSSDGSTTLPTNGQDYSSMENIVEEALLPFFQKFDMRPLLVRVDYIPERVDLAALRGGKYVELVNLMPWKGVELQLKHVRAVGVYGWSNVCETIIGEWLEDISQNQIHKVLRGIPTVRSLVSLGSAAAKLVSCPLENYRKDHRVLKGVQRGTVAFLRSLSLEAVGLGVHLAAGAHDILLQAECVLSSLPASPSWPGQSGKKPNVRSNQPKDVQQGIRKAYGSLSDGLEKSASALIQTPIKKYQRGAGASAAIATAFKGVPAATIAPVSACASAVHYALLGLRNSLDPEHKKESMEKYLGPNPPQE